MSVSQAAPHPATCDRCGGRIEPVAFRDGTRWSVAQLSEYSLKRFEAALCMDCYRSANKARRHTRAVERRKRTPWEALNELRGYVATLRRQEEALAAGTGDASALPSEAPEHACQVLDLITARIDRMLQTTDPPS